MIKYKKIKIKNEEDAEELNINDIEPLHSFGDIRFRDGYETYHNSAIVFSYSENPLHCKVAKLNKKVDWIIREYEGELYLISLKRDC